jgi:serine protease Do
MRGRLQRDAAGVPAISIALAVLLLSPLLCLADDAAARVRAAEQQRIETIQRASRSVVCILTPDRSNGGSGVIVTADGYGITNFHVVASMLQTRRGLGGLADGKLYPLEVLGIDPTGDLAMFRLTGRDRFDAAPLGDSDALRVGDAVIAMGNPFMLAEDFTASATFGIISGLNRYQHGADARSLVYTDCIQIDASINPGNSGGPLFDMEGRVIGINGRASFKKDDPLGALRQRVNVGVAYAISINQIKRFMPALKEGWLVEHGSLGATVADTPQGVLFDRMLQSSAAERIGIQRGDEIASFDGRPITSANAFANALGVYPAGWPVTVVYRRGAEEFRREVALDPLQLKQEIPWTKADPAWIRSVAEGATPTTLPFDAASMAHPPSTSRSSVDPLIASLMPHVVKIYGGRIGGQRGLRKRRDCRARRRHRRTARPVA